MKKKSSPSCSPIEQLTAQMTEEKNLLKGEKELVAEETEKVRANIEAINKGKKEKDGNEANRRRRSRRSTLRKYDTLRQRRNGLAVVNVVDGVCQGCFMAIPPQLFNRLLRGDELFDCPTCQRMIHYRPARGREKLGVTFSFLLSSFPTTLPVGAGA